MTKIDYKAVLDRCNELTEKGASLSVTWDGGDDEGEFDVRLDDKVVFPLTPIDEMIIDMVRMDIDFYSFDGPAELSGQVDYDREKGGFYGTDSVAMGASATKDCFIKISIPKEIWFDRLYLGVAIGDNEDASFVRLTVLNGPRIQNHFDLENEMKEAIWCALRNEFSQVRNWERVVIDRSIQLDEFASEGDFLIHTITQVDYDFCEENNTDISISLLEKTQEDDSI